MRAKHRRFAPEQIDAPQAVLRMAEHREPRRSRVRPWRVPDGENASHHILVHGNAKGQGDLLGDPRTPQVGFRCFISTTAAMTFRLGPFGPGLFCGVDENNRRYFRVTSAR